jgi:hypothetical protein
MRTLMQATPPLGALIAGPLLRTGGIRLAALSVSAFLIAPAVAALVLGTLSDRDAELSSPPDRAADRAF